ncbi:MAG: flagellar filament capping protein FliD [Thermodesulfobacteriota bacterium]
MASSNFISGLVSNLDWGTIVDQLMQVSHKRVDTLTARQTDYQDKLSAWQSLNTKLLSLKTASDTLRENDSFNVFTTSLTSSSTTSASSLLSVSTTATATPGTHTIEMTSTSTKAQARQLSSKSFTSKTTALGYSGEFVINGRAINVADTDTLETLRDKVNNANSGTSATGVTATILSVSSTDNRLVLTSDATGADVFNIADASSSTSNILQSLGITDSTVSVKHVVSNGALSDKFSSSTTAVGSLLGLTSAQTGAVTISGTGVTINLATQSLTDIRDAMNTAGLTASIVTTTEDGVTKYQLKVNETLSANYTDANNVLETLGILVGGQSSVAEVLTSDTSNTKTTAAGGGYIAAATKWGEINTGSDANNIVNGDTITITGTKRDGTAASGTYTITDKTVDTVQGLLTAIETALGLSAGSATVTADGKIKVTDNTSGDSQLTLSLICNNQGNGTLNLGTITATTQGYSMQTVAGQDAWIKIDGVIVTRSSNTIDDVIPGVTLDLLKMESGTTLTLNISRDTETITSNVEDFIAKYNDVNTFINEQFTYNTETEEAGVLMGDASLSTIQASVKAIIAGEILGLPADIDALSNIGITSDKTGTLSLDSTTWEENLADDFNAVKRIFISEGTTTDGDVVYMASTENTKAGTYDINITTAAAQATVTGATDLSGGLAGAEVMTITDTYTGRVATVSLSSGWTTDTIVNAINSELTTEYTQIIAGDVKNTTDAGGTTPITSSTTWNQIYSGGVAANLQNNDVISFSGTKKNGLTVSGSYTISDVSTDTVQGLLSAIENAFGNEVDATINTNGYITVTDTSAGDSQLSLTITEPATRNLNFGTLSTANSGGVVGRYAMSITASNSSNYLKLTHGSYGSAYGFTVSQTVNNTGITDDSYAGVNVAGTINGEAATGNGQILTGDSGNANTDGLAIKVTLTAAQLASQGSAQGSVKLTLGVSEQMYQKLDYLTDTYDGYIDVRTDGIQDVIDDLQSQIDAMEKRLEKERETLTNQFIAMENSLAALKTISNWLSSQLNSLY